MATNQSWALYTAHDCIWRNPFNPAVVGNGGEGIDPRVDTYVEVTSALPQGGPGNWVNVMPGSGIFMLLPANKTLVARNKIDALMKLGMSAVDIANMYGEDGFVWDGWAPTVQKYSANKDYISTTFGISNLPDLLTAVADNKNNVLALEWISDCPIVDNQTYNLAKAKGYDFVQYYCTGYGGGYWANEIMCTMDTAFGPLASGYMYTTTDRCPSVETAKPCTTCEPFKPQPFVTAVLSCGRA